MNRDTLAAALLGLGSLAFGLTALHFAIEVDLRSAARPLLIGGAHAVLALGVLRRRPGARWLAMGASFFWVFFALLTTRALSLMSPDAARWVLVALHAPLPLLLARPDALHARTSASLLLTGLGLVPALALGAETAMALRPSLVPALAGAAIAAGAFGIARERTWGLLAVAGAGLALAAHGASQPAGLASDAASALGLVLLAAALPFAKPIARFLRG